MGAEVEYDERQAYLEIFRRDAAIYQATPARRFVERTKLRRKLRYAYGDAVGAGANVSMPLTAWGERKDGVLHFLSDAWGESYNRGWLFWSTVILTAACIISVFLYLVIGVGIFDGAPPKPLPPEIQQRGYTFIIPANYELRANYADTHADDLCGRLPQWDSRYDSAHADPGPGGTIVIRCDR